MRYAILLNLAIVSCVLAALLWLSLLEVLSLRGAPSTMRRQDQGHGEARRFGLSRQRLNRPHQHSERS